MGATATTVVTTVLGCGVVALLAAVVLLRRRTATELDRRERLEQELVRARVDVAELGRRVDDLSHEVVAARATAELAAAPDREFVITSLGDSPGDSLGDPEVALGQRREVTVRGPLSALEDRLLEAVSRHHGTTSGAVATRTLVRAAALGHGVRRALSADVLDRAAAEATVARRRSRRDRKRELRDARRVLRTVQERPSGKHVA